MPKPVRVNAVARCGNRHPMYGDQVRCEEAKGHEGPHFQSFYMRSWEDNHGHGAIWSQAVASGPCTSA
jgi:hypothetical protein